MMEKETIRQPSLPNFQELFEDSLFEFLPYSDLSRWVPEQSTYEEAQRSTKALLRLGNIKALSFLSFIGPRDPKDNFYIEHHHTRFDHSLVVALTTEQILRQNGASLDQINVGIVAGLFHDIATPALGDAIKQLDPKNLNEEDFWWETLDTRGKNFVRRFADKETLDRIIKNQGPLGEVLDIADRITYVMKDLYNVIGPIKPEEIESNPLLTSISNIISFYPKIGNIYRDVGVDQKKGKVFFNDPNMLYAFLLLRATLHREFYLHPINQGRDLFIAKLLEPLYSKDDTSKLTPSLLRQMTDHDLLEIICGKYFPDMLVAESAFFSLVNWLPLFEKLDTQEEAIARAKQLQRNSNVAVVGIKKCRGFDSGISYNVVGKNGRILSFSEFDPYRAKALQTLGESTKGFFVFYADVSEESPTNTLLKTVLKK
ncbi:MAG: hypothetical protein Q7R31_02230 [Candidatus Levybacteria bacterium]|nr:hypothetical protein [Candidatus Levybacteria bacterium]